MSEIIDTNVVEIQFDNEQFIENVSQTVEAVNTLKNSLQFDANSFDNLSKAANNIDLSNIANSLETISDRFSTFGIVGMTAIQRITNEVMTLGGKLVSLVAKPWQQIVTGGTARAANIAKARFQLEGIFGKTEEGARKLKMAMDADAAAIEEMTGYTEDLVVAMDAANYAVADTAYGLDSAAKAASVLATSGVDVTHYMDTLADSSGKMRTEMQVALRSISGVAAMANASYDDIAHTFERISGNGRVFAIDLRSLSAQGLNAAATLRDYLNETREDVKLTEQDIREMVKKGEIDFMTFAMAMDSAYGDHAKDANNTFNGALSNMKFGLSKIGADFIGPLRTQLIPIFNDLRMSINNVRKALNFKMEFPGLEDEISIVEAFTRIVTNLSERLHDLFTVWMGGQNAAEKAISGMSDATGVSFAQMKALFKEVEDGAKTVDEMIDGLSKVSIESSTAVDEVISQLAETLDKTDEEVREMCKNGEISFEQFSNAASAAFGNNVWDKRVSRTAYLLRNLALTAKNLGNGVASFVGPVVEGFFRALAEGNKDIVTITDSMAKFTEKLKLSYNAQRSLAVVSYKIFMTLKHFVSLSFRVVRAIWRILEPFAPLIDDVLKFAEVLATAVENIVDIAINSDLLKSTIELLTAAFRLFGGVLVSILRVIINIAAPAMKVVATVFSLLAKVLTSFNFTFLSKIAEGFEKLFHSVFVNVILNGFVLAITIFLGVIKSLADGITAAFERLHSIIAAIIYVIGQGIETIVGFFVYLGQKLVSTIKRIVTFLTDNLLKIVAITQEVLIFTALYNILNFGKVVSRVIEALGFKVKTEGIIDLAKSVKILAEAFLIMAAACIALSLIPEDRLRVVYKLLYTISRMVAAMAIIVMAYRLQILYMKKAVTLATAKALFIDQAKRSLITLTRALRGFINALKVAVTLKAVAVTVLAFVAALWIFGKALKQLSDIDSDKFAENFDKIGKIMILLVGSMVVLERFAKGAGLGMVGVSVAMLAFLVVLKTMVSIIDEYAAMEYGIFKWIGITVRLGTTMALLTAAMAVMGNYVKGAGFGLMGSTVAMLGFLVVLRTMEVVINEYAQIDFLTVASSMLKMALVMGVFVSAIVFMADAIGGNSSFSASLRNGVSMKRNSKNFIGLILTMFSLCIVLNMMAKITKTVAESGIVASLGTIGMIIAATYGIAEMMNSMKGVNGLGNLFGIALVVTAISTALFAFTLLDTNQILAAAVSLGIIFETLAHSMTALATLGKVKGGYVSFNPVPIMGVILLPIGSALAMINLTSGGDWKTTLASTFALARIIAALAIVFRIVSTIKIANGVNIVTSAKWMTTVAYALGGVVIALTGAAYLFNGVDPAEIIAMSVSIGIIALAMAGTLRIINGIAVTPGIWKPLMSIAVSLGTLAIMLAVAGSLFKGSESGIISLTAGLLILTPLIFTLAFVVGMLSS